MLNSLSSWPKAAPVSAVLASLPVSSKPCAFADDHGFENAQQPVAVVGEILQHLDRAAGIAHDGHQIGGCHLRSDELLRGGERAQLIRGRHGGHVEIQSQQPAIFVASVARRFGRDLGSVELVVDVNVLRLRIG